MEFVYIGIIYATPNFRILCVYFVSTINWVKVSADLTLLCVLFLTIPKTQICNSIKYNAALKHIM